MSSSFDPDFQSYSTEAKIVASLERVSEAFRVLLWNESKAYGLSPLQVQVLIFLHYHSEEKCTVSYLAKEFNVAKPTISDTIKILERKELITKVNSPIDTRSFVIVLTVKGKHLAATTSSFSQPIQQPIEQLSKAQKEELLNSLVSVISQLNSSGIINVQRMCFNCSHYRARQEGHQHYCNLLKTSLQQSQLRVDCNEHQPV